MQTAACLKLDKQVVDAVQEFESDLSNSRSDYHVVDSKQIDCLTRSFEEHGRYPFANCRSPLSS